MGLLAPFGHRAAAALVLLPASAGASDDPAFAEQRAWDRISASAAHGRATGAGAAGSLPAAGHSPAHAAQRLPHTADSEVGGPVNSPTGRRLIDPAPAPAP